MDSQLYGLNFLQLYGLLYGLRQLLYEVITHYCMRWSYTSGKQPLSLLREEGCLRIWIASLDNLEQ